MSRVLFARARQIVDGESTCTVMDTDRLLTALVSARILWPEADGWIDLLLEYRAVRSLEEGPRG